ncbi:MAG: histidine phosphatase family protein [Gammaproteobacteria bacterium]
MIRRVTLLRHAKSSHHDMSLRDHDRPLSPRGERDAPLMGRRLVAKGNRPSLILTSTAARARHTARLFAQAIGYPIEFVQSERELYLADPATILDVIAAQDNTFNDIVVCGHNPGITELAGDLGRASIDNVPTCGIVILDAEVDRWDELPGARCDLVAFDYPKNPASA